MADTNTKPKPTFNDYMKEGMANEIKTMFPALSRFVPDMSTSSCSCPSMPPYIGLLERHLRLFGSTVRGVSAWLCRWS
jgi:hypothetical protein